MSLVVLRLTNANDMLNVTAVVSWCSKRETSCCELYLLSRCVIVVGLPYPSVKSAELREKMDYLNAHMVCISTLISDFKTYIWNWIKFYCMFMQIKAEFLNM